MKQSQYFLKTSKTFSEEDSIISARLLKRAGFIQESVAGRYYFLPIGHKVQQKIMKIVKEEMDGVGAQEMISPILHPVELWKETNRTSTTGFELMKVRDRRGSEFALGGTAEEMFVDLVRKLEISYKDLPFHLYQFSPKFRDELRARGGLLRVREFIMKDGYSFHRDENDFSSTYEEMKRVYSRIFARMGLHTAIVEADNGYIGGEYCHEFIVEADSGESRYFTSNDGTYAAHEDVAVFKRNPANADSEMLPFEIISQPEWVKTMDDNVKHYQKEKNHFLKNVVYKNRVTNEIIIAVVTGDLEVNQTKLEHALSMVGQLIPAEDTDLESIGTKHGYVHCWGHAGARYIGDVVLSSARNLIGGQKEDTTDSINVNYGRDFSCEALYDIAVAKEGDISVSSGSPLSLRKGIEVGNTFQLGYHYTNLMKGAVYRDEDGSEKPYYMGCYGIGIGRTMAAIVEKYHDEKGIVWPISVAPFLVHELIIGSQTEDLKKVANSLYTTLNTKGIEVLFDDRDGMSAGAKFADADLIGIPYRVVVSEKTMNQGKIEVKKRADNSVTFMTVEEFITLIKTN
ncbi:proline--tRNA ligase [Candidatus Parcubacteria bacterium]|jgi:prolyl-tRNA synthetase|nr:MAG: proline--tRNA ligase [Candidatus Parcubacteria bacterium]